MGIRWDRGFVAIAATLLAAGVGRDAAGAGHHAAANAASEVVGAESMAPEGGSFVPGALGERVDASGRLAGRFAPILQRTPALRAAIEQAAAAPVCMGFGTIEDFTGDAEVAGMNRAQLDRALTRVCSTVVSTFSAPEMPGTEGADRVDELLGELGTGDQCFGSVRPQSDAEIAGILDALHEREIEQNRMAAAFVEGRGLTEYANGIAMSALLARSKEEATLAGAGVVPQTNDLSQALVNVGEPVIAVGAAPGQAADLDEAYIDLQVVEQLSTLQMVDALEEQARSEALACALSEARLLAAEHLAFACAMRAEPPPPEGAAE